MPDSLPINAVDIGVLIEVLLGALVGLALGFVRGVICSVLDRCRCGNDLWLTVRPTLCLPYIDDRFFADLAAGVAIFLLALSYPVSC